MNVVEQLRVNRARLVAHAVSGPMGDWIGDAECFLAIDEAIEGIDRALAAG